MHTQSIKIFTRALTTIVEHPKRLKHFKTLELKNTHYLFAVTKVTPVEREHAIGMLQANMTPSVVAPYFTSRY